MACNQCGGSFTVGPSDFPGWNVLQCRDCSRPIKLLPLDGHRVGPVKHNKAQVNRMLRAQRRTAR